MTRKFKTALAIVAAAGAIGVVMAQGNVVKYEAEAATLSGEAEIVQLAGVSGGAFVKAKGGGILFNITAPTAGFYTVWAQYAMTYGDPGSSKRQNIFVNNASQGEATFERTRATGSEGDPTAAEFEKTKVAGKVTLNAGPNTFEIRNSWGWVDIDYIEVEPFAEESFNLSSQLVTAKHGVTPSANAQKVYQFMREYFQKKIISGVMVGYALVCNDGSRNPHTLATLPETKHVFDKSNKYPALLGLDFFHGTGYKSDDMWFMDENGATLALAEELFDKGGIPHFMWHWKDPNNTGPFGGNADRLFYTDGTDFDLSKAFTGSAHDTWNTSSDEYKNIIKDIDIVAGYLKTLADKNIPVLWRPLHEASGGWFWWGAAGGSLTTPAQKARANKELWILMFERMVKHHGLDNLIWIWTCEESGPPLAWYPGDEYVDIIGRDYYAWPDADNKQVYGSLVSNFENLKDIYGGTKIIGLSEQGTVPDPDSLMKDGAGWSFFMSWNERFLRNANPDAHWNRVMNHDYVLTLEDMHKTVGTGWASYDLTNIAVCPGATSRKTAGAARAPAVTVRGKTLNVIGTDNTPMAVRLVNVQGRTVARFTAAGRGSFSLAKIPAGRYVVETRVGGRRVGASSVVVR